jgi:hypothetical protein
MNKTATRYRKGGSALRLYGADADVNCIREN